MPSIDVLEKDMSWYYRTQDPSALTVLTPIVSTWGPYDPTLVDASNFVSTYGSEIVDATDLSYPIAASLIKSGLTLLGVRVDLGGEAAKISEDQSATLPLPLEITAAYDGTLGNSLEVNISNIKPVFSIPYTTTIAVSDTTSWDITETYLFTGDSVNNGVTNNHVYKYVTNEWVDQGEETLVSITCVARVTVGTTVLETLTYDLLSPDSIYYYVTTNQSSQYIHVKPYGTYTVEQAVAAKDQNFSVQLSGGTNSADALTHDGIVDALVTSLDADIHGSGYGGVINDLFDPLVYDFDIIISAGYNYYEGDTSHDADDDPGIDSRFVELVSKRGTAIYLVDDAPTKDASDFYADCGDAKFRTGTDYSNAGSYCAAYGPWCYTQLLSTGATRKLPGSYVFLVAWARAIANGAPMYLAPAGVKRSSLGTIVRSTDYPVGSAIINAWQNAPNGTYKINPIAKLKQYGYVVYGNSTLLDSDPITGKSSMLQSFSTRVMVNLIKRRAFDISLTLQFDQIDSDIFAEFKTTLSSFMNELKYNNALYDYDIIADRSKMTLDELNQRTVPVKILISPAPAAENFEINLEIYPAGVVFGDDTTENLQLAVGD